MRLGGDRLLGLFQHMLAQDVPWMRESAVMALALFNSPRVVSLLKAVYLKETGTLQELAFRGLEKLAGMGNDGAARMVVELKALREPPRLDVDFANLDDDADESGEGLGFEDTYTGGKLPRIEMGSPLDDDDPLVQSGAGFSRAAAVEPPNPGSSGSAIPRDAMAVPPPAPAPEKKPNLGTSGSAIPREAMAPPPAPAPEKRPNLGTSGSAISREAMAPRAESAPSNFFDPSGGPDPMDTATPAQAPAPAPARPAAGPGAPTPRRRPDAAAGPIDGGMVAPRRMQAQEDEDGATCPACGAAVSASARRCNDCNEVFEPVAAPEEHTIPMPVDLVVVAAITVIYCALEAALALVHGVRQVGGVAALQSLLYIVELVAAVGAARGFAWGWYIWWPLCFLWFIASVSNGEGYGAGRTCASLLVMSRAGVRDYCTK